MEPTSAREKRRRQFELPIQVARNLQNKLKLATGDKLARQPSRFDLDDVGAVYDFATLERQTLIAYGVGAIVPQNGTATAQSFVSDRAEREQFQNARRVVYRGMSAFIDIVNPVTTLYVDLLVSFRGPTDLGEQLFLVDHAEFDIANAPQVLNASFFGTSRNTPIPCGNSQTVSFGTGVISDEVPQSSQVVNYFEIRFRRVAEATGSAQVFDVKFNFDFEY